MKCCYAEIGCTWKGTVYAAEQHVARCVSRISRNSNWKWKNGHYKLTRIEECSEEVGEEGVCCLQYDKKKIVGGCRDNMVKVHTYMILSLYVHSYDLLLTSRSGTERLQSAV